MLDIKFIRKNPDQVKKAIKDKQLEGTVDLDELLKVDENLKTAIKKYEEHHRKWKDAQKVTEELVIKEGTESEGAKENIRKTKALRKEDKKLWKDVVKLKEEKTRLMLLVPNVTHPDMHVGKGEEDNKVIKTEGDISEFGFDAKDHVELGKLLDVIDVEKSGEISGPRTYYLKNEAVLLQFALLQLVFDTLTDQKIISKLAKKVGNPFDKPFSPMLPPPLMKPEVMNRMDRLHPIDDRYEMKLDDLVLVGSAEHTMGPYHMGETFKEEDLPIRYIGYSTAYRREAGSYGRDVRGILRGHHFDKAELETFVPVEYGDVEQDFIIAIQEYLVQQLEIPYQLMQMCTGDTGKPDYNQIDLNCWLPGQQKYRETHTSDYMTDFQARRLNIRYLSRGREKKYVYMNDATAFAMGRILIAILENYQKEDGSVEVPKVLRKYTGFKTITPAKT